MLNVESKPWDHLPIGLHTNEIQDPYSVIGNYYETYATPRARKYLTTWFEALQENGRWNFDLSANLLYFYERTVQLMEAASLIAQLDNKSKASVLTKEGLDLMDPKLFFGYYPTYCAWDYFPRSLSKREFINPYRVYKKFFDYKPLAEWRFILRELLHTALSSNAKMDDIGSFNIIKIRKHLHKLLEAGSLIDIRELKQNENVLQIIIDEVPA